MCVHVNAYCLLDPSTSQSTLTTSHLACLEGSDLGHRADFAAFDKNRDLGQYRQALEKPRLT